MLRRALPATPLLAPPALAQQPPRSVNGFAAGGMADILARPVAGQAGGAAAVLEVIAGRADFTAVSLGDVSRVEPLFEEGPTLDARIASDRATWGEVIRAANIRAD